MNDKLIYLWVTKKGWKAFKLSDSAALAERGIEIHPGASIGDGAYIGNGAYIGDRASIGDGAKPKTLFILGSMHPIMYWGENKIQIGCKIYSIEKWESEYQEIGSSEHYRVDQIEEYSGYIQMVKSFHAIHQTPIPESESKSHEPE